MRKGRRLAIDVGTVRIGLATCDQDGILATPLPAVKRESSQENPIEQISLIAKEHEVLEIIVGDPLSLSGSATKSTSDARAFAREIAAAVSVPVRLVDERLTTVSASNKLRQAGLNSKSSKDLIDSASAVEILEQALNFEKSTSLAPGKSLEEVDE